LVSFSYNLYKAKDSVVYAAFIVGKNYKFPKFITLFKEKQLALLLDRSKNQQDSTRIDKQYLEKAISSLILKPLEKELEGVSTIYLSPSGLGHQINFAALPVNDNQTLGNKYKLHILSSPAELIDYSSAKFEKGNNLELLLYGGIDYDKVNSIPNTNIAKTENNGSQTELQTRSSITGFGYLKGSKKEVEQIQFKGTQSGFKTTLLNDRAATEESIKQLDGRKTPFILHLATHGFFFPDPIKETPKDIFDLEGKSKIYKASDDPMMRSGLLFSGANKYWGKNIENTTTEDGILTASEISNLDLSACQLVVLSACETGLGEVKGSEGVFGLQRAFKMAGVKNIIMSLWKVPDTQTAELFDIFYNECFAGKSIHEAFRAAQLKMKEKYTPYYWAGFVLLE
jgi:CHAT domain-containing protein